MHPRIRRGLAEVLLRDRASQTRPSSALTDGETAYPETAASEDHDCATLQFISEGVEVGDDESGLLVGVIGSDDRNRMNDGLVNPRNANNAPKSVSWETTIRSSLAA